MRKIFVVGKPVTGKTVLIPPEMLSRYTLVNGATYEVVMDVNIEDPSKLNEENFEKVKSELKRKLGVDVKYFEVVEHKGRYEAVMQLSGAPVTSSSLGAILMALMPLIGIAVAGIAIYYVIKKYPGLITLGIIGLLLLMGLPGLLGELGGGE